jgi:flagellar protein FliO/FliZ
MKIRALPPASGIVLAAALFAAARVCAAQPAGPAADPGSLLYPRIPGAGGAPAAAPAASGPTMILFVMVAGAAGGWLLWRRLRGGSAPVARGEHRLSVTESRSLGNRQYLVVAAYGDKKFLLGVCPGRIDLLAPLDGGAPPP